MLSSRLRSRRLPGGRPFTLLLIGLAVSSCGDWLYNVALLALVYARTGSSSWLALSTAARVLPIVVLGPLGGVLAGRFDRRRLLLAGDLGRALAMLALVAVAVAGLPTVLLPLIAAIATAAGIAHPACVASCTARMVEESELQRASALRVGIGQGSVVAGPVLGALILLVADPAVALLANAITFVVSAATTLAIPAGPVFRPPERQAAAPCRVFAELAHGAAALRSEPTAVRLLAADVLCSAVYGLLTVTLVLVSRTLGAGPGGYGLLLAAFGGGGVLGSVLASRVDAPAHWRRTLLVALGLVGVTIAALGVAPSLATALALALLGGAGMVVGEVLGEAALPRILDDAVLAGAYGFVLPTCVAGILAGALIAGPLVTLLGLTGALGAGGLFVLVTGALLLNRPLQLPSAADAAAA